MADDKETIQKVLQVAQEAARLAGQTILEVTETSNNNIQSKSSSTDLVTETDQKCEALITQCIQTAFPTHAIIGEETSAARYELTDHPTWTIDPIDGTTNFVHQLQMSCVIISYIVNGNVQVGVIYDPYMDELFYAVKGQGAFVQHKDKTRPIHVSSTTSIPQAVISLDPGYGRDVPTVERFGQLQKAILFQGVRNIRVIGATGLNMTKVAAGRLDAALEEGSWESGNGPKIWDFAAGRLLVEEAGGVTVDMERPPQELQPADGSLPPPLDLMKRSFFCASSHELAASLLQVIAKSRQSS